MNGTVIGRRIRAFINIQANLAVHPTDDQVALAVVVPVGQRGRGTGTGSDDYLGSDGAEGEIGPGIEQGIGLSADIHEDLDGAVADASQEIQLAVEVPVHHPGEDPETTVTGNPQVAGGRLGIHKAAIDGRIGGADVAVEADLAETCQGSALADNEIQEAVAVDIRQRGDRVGLNLNVGGG